MFDGGLDMMASSAGRLGALLRPVAIVAMLAAAAAAVPFQSPRLHAQTAAKPAPQVPDPYRLNMLIRTTLIALNHANRTGNYTVLRDLSAPAFQRTNNAARLAEIFATLRKRDLDLSPILFFQPKLSQPASINENGLLRLTGFFDTKPERISFDMLFQSVGEIWQLFGVAVDVSPPKPEAAVQPQGQQTQPAQEQKETPANPPRAEGATTRDSASARLPEANALEPAKPVFIPQKVSISLPVRRPAPASAAEPEAGTDDRADSSQPTALSDGDNSFWPF